MLPTTARSCSTTFSQCSGENDDTWRNRTPSFFMTKQISHHYCCHGLLASFAMEDSETSTLFTRYESMKITDECMGELHLMLNQFGSGSISCLRPAVETERLVRSNERQDHWSVYLDMLEQFVYPRPLQRTHLQQTLLRMSPTTEDETSRGRNPEKMPGLRKKTTTSTVRIPTHL